MIHHPGMMVHSWIDRDSTLLSPAFPLPLDRPFTTAYAAAHGVAEGSLRSLVRTGHLRRHFHGVYAAAQAPDNVLFRARALSLIVPEDAVVSGRTAAWRHGIPILERGSHLVAPPLHLSDTRDTRMRRAAVHGDRRALAATDWTEVHGIRVTTVLRTACDLGRQLWRFDALAALDGALGVGLRHEDLLMQVERFKGFRGVRQLRVLAPYADALAESPGESALRLHWLDAGLPVPTLQYVLRDGDRSRYRLDVALDQVRYAVEYDGEQHHTSARDREHDTARRDWIAEHGHWTVDVFTKDDVYGRNSGIEQRLRDGVRRARASYSRWSP